MAVMAADMGITYGDHLIDSGYYDITPEQEREIEAREECARRDIDPDAECADGGTLAWMIVAKEISERAQRNKLVIDAYRAFDAIDAIRKWCDEQQYANDTITVAKLRAMLPH